MEFGRIPWRLELKIPAHPNGQGYPLGFVLTARLAPVAFGLKFVGDLTADAANPDSAAKADRALDRWEQKRKRCKSPMPRDHGQLRRTPGGRVFTSYD